MKEQWRSSPQPSEQEPPAAQQAEAVPGVDAAPEEISHEEKVCRECGRPYARAHEKEFGKRALKMDVEEIPRVSKRRFTTPEEIAYDFSQRNPEWAAKIRNRFSPEWERGERERIGRNRKLPRDNSLPEVPRFHDPLQY
jgi:hypothetical protein